jgi:hypothetical protein
MTGRGWCSLGYGAEYNIVDDGTVLVRGAADAEKVADTDFNVNETLDRIFGGHWELDAPSVENEQGVLIWRKQPQIIFLSPP